MSNYKGYLFASVNSDDTIKKKFPLKYIDFDSYSSLPNSREEIKAVREENSRDLFRVTSKGHKSSITFSTIDDLSIEELTEILNFFTSSEVDANQRKIRLNYWNDESLNYKTSYFYRPDINYKIKEASDTNLSYNSLEISLVEY